MELPPLVAAAEADVLARGFTAASIIIAVGAVFIARRSMIIAREAYDRGGYEMTISVEAFANDLPPIGPDDIVRRTDVVITVANHRMGKIQLTRFHGEIEGKPSYEIGVLGPELGYTFDGIHKAEWHTGWHEKHKPNQPHSPQTRVRVGAELANSEIVWSGWVEVDSSVADKVLGSRY
ncbi:hypothetical protein ABZ815_20330 [Nonomuraea sp. NPDC047529]|uniref:hypothetical protein n=1 Tax=Nonomuraea sp. NPDC047529 TaxID=3155623 RepID=UPI0033CB9013